MKLALLLLLLAVIAVHAKDPPVYDFSYQITFDESYIVDKTTYRVNGQKLYDPANDRERVDRANGRYNLFCGTVLPNVTAPCQQITTQGKRWIVFPTRSICCFCCDKAHGCGILRPDWLNGAEYMGEEKIIDTNYDKWSKKGDFGYNYWWNTNDENTVPRRLDQNGEHITDYNVHSFRKQAFQDSAFALPSYCNIQSPSNCPLTSICGKLRAANQ